MATSTVGVLKRVGDQAFSKVEKINSELFILTYGGIVAQLIQDYEDVEEVNIQLEKMGYNIGMRLIDEFLSRSNTGRCQSFKDTAEVIAKVGFKMFLGITANVVNYSPDEKEFSILLDDNPLAEFVELPDTYSNLHYSNILCGVIRGSLEMVQMKVECKFVKDVLRGDDTTELRVTFKEFLAEAIPTGEE